MVAWELRWSWRMIMWLWVKCVDWWSMKCFCDLWDTWGWRVRLRFGRCLRSEVKNCWPVNKCMMLAVTRELCKWMRKRDWRDELNESQTREQWVEHEACYWCMIWNNDGPWVNSDYELWMYGDELKVTSTSTLPPKEWMEMKCDDWVS